MVGGNKAHPLRLAEMTLAMLLAFECKAKQWSSHIFYLNILCLKSCSNFYGIEYAYRSTYIRRDAVQYPIFVFTIPYQGLDFSIQHILFTSHSLPSPLSQVAALTSPSAP
jgi:hypothetical protein